MKYKLGLEDCAKGGDGASTRYSKTTFQYRVTGLPPRHEAFIREVDGRWKLMLVIDGVQSNWTGDYESPEAVRDELQKEFD